MGSGITREKEGVPANPRLVYTNNLSNNNNKPMLLDTPVLIDVDHGSIRYRYSKYKNEPADVKNRTERPYTGTQTIDKQHYFYHARLNPNNTDPSADDFKRLYVAKGPATSKDKFLYYVYGKGFDAQDGCKTLPSLNKTQDKDYTWTVHRYPNDVYYKLTFPDQNTYNITNDLNEEDMLVSQIESTPDKSSLRLQVCESDTIIKLKSLLAVKLLKAAGNLHIMMDQKELRNEDVISDLRIPCEQQTNVFMVELSRL